MSLIKDILKVTAKYYPVGYKELYEYLYTENKNKEKPNKNSLSATLSRMKRDGLLEIKKGRLRLTKAGAGRLNIEPSIIRKFLSVDKKLARKKKQRNLIVMFDIPEKYKAYREWLRSELISFDFVLVQKSVWFGPPLPREFVELLDEFKILKYVKFFHASENDII